MTVILSSISYILLVRLASQFLSKFLIIFTLQFFFLQFGFYLLILFPLLGLDLLYSFSSTVCTCRDLFESLIHFLFKEPHYIHEGYCKALLSCFGYAVFLRVCHGRLLGSRGDTLSWLLLIVFLHWLLGTWDLEYYTFRYWYPCFLFPFWS